MASRETPPLDRDLTIAEEVVARLFASTDAEEKDGRPGRTAPVRRL